MQFKIMDPRGEVNVLHARTRCGGPVAEAPLQRPVGERVEVVGEYVCLVAVEGEAESRVLPGLSLAAVGPERVDELEVGHGHGQRRAAALLVADDARRASLHEGVVGDGGVPAAAGRFPAEEGHLIQQHLLVQVFDEVEPGVELVLGGHLPALAAFFGMSAGPVDQLVAVEEAEARLVARGGEAPRAGGGQLDPAAVDAEVVVGVAEGVEAVTDVADDARAVGAGGVGEEPAHLLDGLRVVRLDGPAMRGEDEAGTGDPVAAGGRGRGRTFAGGPGADAVRIAGSVVVSEVEVECPTGGVGGVDVEAQQRVALRVVKRDLVGNGLAVASNSRRSFALSCVNPA